MIFGVTGVSGQQMLSADAILAQQLSPSATWVDSSMSGEQALFVAGKDSNALYVKQGNGTYVDMAHEYGIERGYIQGDKILSDAADLNSDGCADLYVRDFTLDPVGPEGRAIINHTVYLGDCNGAFTILLGGELDAGVEAELDQSLATQSQVTAASVRGDVVVLGTAAADFIKITSTGSDVGVDILKDGQMEGVESFAGGAARVVIFGGAGENFVTVDPTEEILRIFKTGPSRAQDLFYEFMQTPRPLLGGVGIDPSEYHARPVSGTCCNVSFTGGDDPEVFTGGCGNDNAVMKGGNDGCSMGSGGDFCTAGNGDDQLYAGIPAGSPDRDRLFGYANDDRLYASDSRDELNGGQEDHVDTGYGCSIAGVSCVNIEVTP